ncbi:hypothetical protein APR48_31995 [Variovorax paradoxus]|nr:hypothetical protein APR48_31995 [Variovorax paradoxus]
MPRGRIVERAAGLLPREHRQRMRGGRHRHHRQRQQELARDALVELREGRDRDVAAAAVQRFDWRAHRAVLDAHRDARMHRVHAADGGRHEVDREQRVDRDRQAELDALLDPLRAGAQGIDLREDLPHVAQQRLARGREHGLVARTVEQPHLQLLLEVGDGLAHGRLHAVQPVRARAEAAGLGHHREHLHLGQRERIQHGLLLLRAMRIDRFDR